MRTTRAIFNFGMGLVFTGSTVLLGLIGTPLLLAWLGPERFGAFRAASDWFGYLVLLELGLGGALLPLFARARESGDPLEVRRTLTAAIRAYARVVCGMLAVGLVLALGIAWLVPASPPLAAELRTGCLLALAGLLWIPISFPFRALREAEQRSHWVQALLLGQSLTVTTSSLLFAWLGWGIPGQFLAVLVGGALLHLVMVGSGIREHRGVVRAALRGEPEPDTWRHLWRLNRRVFILQLSGRVSLMTDNILIAEVLGPAAVVPFYLTQRLPVIAREQLQGVGNASWAALAQLHLQGQQDIFNRRLLQLSSWTSALGVATLVPIAVWNEDFIRLWIGGPYLGAWVTVLVSINAFLQALYSLWGWCFAGTDRLESFVPVMVTQSIVNLVASLCFTLTLGVIGPLLGTLAGYLVLQWQLPRLLQRSFGIGIRDLYRAVLTPVALGIPLAILLRYLSQEIATGGWLLLCTQMSAASVLYLACWWIVGVDRSQRQALLSAIGIRRQVAA